MNSTSTHEVSPTERLGFAVFAATFVTLFVWIIGTLGASEEAGFPVGLPTHTDVVLGLGLMVLAFMAARGLPVPTFENLEELMLETLEQGDLVTVARYAVGGVAVGGAAFAGIFLFSGLWPVAMLGVTAAFAYHIAPTLEKAETRQREAAR